MSAARISTKDEADHSSVIVAGALSEEVDFLSVRERIRKTTVRIDLSGVTRINSGGVREWVYFVRDLEREGRSIVLEKCSPSIVHQLNQIENFCGQSGRVASVLAPYCCGACDFEHQQLYVLEGEVELLESIACPRCGESAELDAFRDGYLSFL